MARKNTLQITLLGTRFTIEADEDPQHLKRILSLYETKIREVEAKLPSKDPLRTAILSGILLADDVLKGGSSPTEGSVDADSREAERLTDKMLRLLDGIE